MRRTARARDERRSTAELAAGRTSPHEGGRDQSSPSGAGIEVPGGKGHRYALRFLTALHPAGPDGRLVLWTTRRQLTLWPDDVASAAKSAAMLAREDEVFFGVATRHRKLGGRRGTAPELRSLPALWGDLKVRGAVGGGHELPPHRAAAWAILDGFPLAPSAIVHTADAIQAYWLLARPFVNSDPATTQALVTSLGQALAAVARCHGWRLDEKGYQPAHGLRLPGTFHRLGHRRYPVRLEHLEAHRRYSLDEMRLAIVSVPVSLRLSA